MVFGLSRVVGCGVCNNFHAFRPLQLCGKACIALPYCGFSVLNTYSMVSVGLINVSFRLSLHSRRETNLDAVSLVHLVEAHALTLWHIEHCLVSCIRNI